MVTLQDISIQLMKPAKDLADWNFPLSQILEEYYALLEAPCDVNFGEAALVLQNSTNVYVRRIERLFSEIEVLKQTFFVYEEEERKSAHEEKKSAKKAYVDFENFVIIDLEKDIGRNIDKKNRCDTQKKVKLLSHRFTQLESNIAQSCIPIQMYDVLGDVIGKKYDFRCNQTINTHGMLVDELTPYDFTCRPGSRVQKGRMSLSSCSEPKTPVTRTSGYESATPPNDNESISFNREQSGDEDTFSVQLEHESPTNDITVTEEENMTNGDCNLPLANASASRQLIPEKDILKKNIQNDLVQNITEVDDRNFSTRNSKDTDETESKRQNENSEQTDDIEEEHRKNNKIEKFEINGLKQLNCKDDQLKKGIQTSKTAICSLEGLNEQDWKPMPLTHGTENVFSTNSSVLKIPEYISCLETKLSSKKRKLTHNRHRPECLTKFVLRESQSLVNKDKFISQKKRKFKRLRKQELDDFMKNFDDCLNGSEKEIDNVRYEAVTNVAIDLLGFRISENQDDFMGNNTEGMHSPSPDVELQSRIRHNSLDSTPASPNMYNDWQEPSISEIDLNYSLPDYQSLIENKMKEIFQESNSATELDQTVAKWHASLQQKLSEAEVRSTFRIHDYASRIIKSLQTLDQKKTSFDSIVEDQPACEVARYFLATLQLANTYNVEIKTEDDNSIQITLLSDEETSEKS